MPSIPRGRGRCAMEMDKFQSLAFRSPDPAIGLVDRHINRSLWQSWLVLFDRSVRSNSATPWTAAHQASLSFTRPPRVCSNSCPLSWWCHPTISSSVNAFSSWLQSFPASGFFPMSWLFSSDGQSIGALASVFPTNISNQPTLSIVRNFIFFQ